MRRLAAFLALLLLALTPAAARSTPAMACCPQPMATAMAGHGDHHRRAPDTAPADAGDCALQAAAGIDLPAVAAPTPVIAGRPLSLRPARLIGLTHAAEPPPPRIA